MSILLCAVMALCQPPDELPCRDIESPVVLGDHEDAPRLPGLALHGFDGGLGLEEGEHLISPISATVLRDGELNTVRIVRSLVAWC